MTPRLRPRLHSHLWVLLAYLAAALLLTWPLARHFFTHVPGDGIDDPSLAWNLWWIGERLVNQRAPDLFHVGWLFHPVGVNLAFYTLTPLNGLLGIPLQGAAGLLAASNGLLLSSFVLSGYGMFLLACQVLRGLAPAGRSQSVRCAAFAGGLFFAFAAPKLFYASLGQFNIASSQWIPFCALFLLRMVQARTIRDAVRNGALAALFLLFQAWAELTFASFLLLFAVLAGIVGIVQVFRGRQRPAVLAAGALTTAGGFALGIAPYLAAMAPDLRAEGDFFASGGGFSDIFSADLAGFLFPTRLHPLFGDFAAKMPFPNDKGQQIFAGYVALALAATGCVWLWRRARGQALFWSGATLFFWLLSLGPSLRWMGRDLRLPGPFAVVNLLPFFNGNRYPSRYGVMLLLCAGVLVAAGSCALLERLTRRRISLWLAAAVLVPLILFEHLALPLPLSDLRIPSVYARLAAEPGDGALLELPTGWRNGARVLGKSDILIMMQQWYQSSHGKRRLGGNTSRNPPHKFQYFTDHPLVGDLITLMNSDRDDLAPTVQQDLDALIAHHAPVAARELADLGVRWVTVHVEQSPPALLTFVEQALPLDLIETWSGANWRGESSEIRLYRVKVPATLTMRMIPLTGAQSPAFLAEGWSALDDASMRYANRPAAHLLFDLPAADGILRFDPPLPEGASVEVNGSSAPFIATPGPVESISYIAAQTHEPIDRVTIRFPGEGTSVHSLALAPSPVGSTRGSLPAGTTLVLRSAGEDVGDFAELWLNGRQLADGGRGYTLAALDAAGTLLEIQRFDTFLAESESQRLATWLSLWPAGTLVAGVAGDEVSTHLTGEAVTALRTLGVDGDLRGRFRWSHAFAGVVGADTGTAAEVVSHLRPAELWLGAPADGARIYGALRSVKIELAGK